MLEEGKKKKEKEKLGADAATLQVNVANAAMHEVEAKKRRKNWRLRSVRYAVLFVLVTRPPFWFVSRRDAVLDQCRCVIELNPSRAKVPREEIDPMVMMESKEEKSRMCKRQNEEKGDLKRPAAIPEMGKCRMCVWKGSAHLRIAASKSTIQRRSTGSSSS